MTFFFSAQCNRSLTFTFSFCCRNPNRQHPSTPTIHLPPSPPAKAEMKDQLDRIEDETISSDEEHQIERDLADVPFGELQKLKSDGTVAFIPGIGSEKKTGRVNKNRPMEVSSKKPVGRFRQVFQVPKKTIRDPRFEPLCGKLDDDGFRKRFNFLFDKNLPAEKEDLQKKLKSSKDPKVCEELKGRIAWIDKQMKSDASMHAEDQILAEHKKRQKEAVKQGKRPFYLKKSEIRKQKLIEKYECLKAAGKVDSYIDKRRKRNAAKDHRFLPYRRLSNEQQ